MADKTMLAKPLFARRIGGSTFGSTPSAYKFSPLSTPHSHVSFLDFGVGDSAFPADSSIVDRLCSEALLAENRFYADNGPGSFQDAAAYFMKEIFNVYIEFPQAQIVHTIGTKSALPLLALAFVDPGDTVAVTVPGYPILSTHAHYLGGQIIELPLYLSNNFLPDLSSLTTAQLNTLKLLYLNYPNNPTGACAPLSFFEDAVRLAQKHNFLIIHDAAYAALTYDDRPPLSILSIPDAINCAIEVHSLSKMFNMTGWRLGFAVGPADLIRAYAHVKTFSDSGQFIAIQKAGEYALRSPLLLQHTRDLYSRRLELLSNMLARVGFSARKPCGTIFCYTPIPTASRLSSSFSNASEFSSHLLQNAKISTIPWDNTGSFVRFSSSFYAPTESDERAFIAEAEERLRSLAFRF